MPERAMSRTNSSVLRLIMTTMPREGTGSQGRLGPHTQGTPGGQGWREKSGYPPQGFRTPNAP